MTREEIIRMAREAGFQVLLPRDHVDGTGGVYVVDDDIAGMLERFAALVEQRAAAAEREACAKVCESRGAEEFGMAYEGIALDCAERIRARGEKA